MSESRPRVTAVVLNWNGLEDTLVCLRSVVRSDWPELDVLVVDNGSRQSAAPHVREAYPQVRVLENATNLGYAGGNNVGIRDALARGADYVWILNNDTEVEAATLYELVQTATARPRVGAVGGKVLRSDDPRRLWVAWGVVTWRQSLVGLVGEDARDDGLYDGEREVEWIPGCSVLYSAEALRVVGALDDDFFAYHEDADWAERARRAGWQCWYTGAARTYHAVHGSSGGPGHYGGFRKYLSARNSILYARKHGTPAQRARLYLWIALTLPFVWLRRAASGEAGGVAMKVRGWRDGWLGRELPLVDLGLR